MPRKSRVSAIFPLKFGGYFAHLIVNLVTVKMGLIGEPKAFTVTFTARVIRWARIDGDRS